MNEEDRLYDTLEGDFRALCGYAIRDIGPCESPIERLLGAAMILGLYMGGYAFAMKGKAAIPWLVLSKEPTNPLRHVFNVVPQYKWKNYRIDFALFVSQRNGSKAEPLKIFIECDGHEYHERTKEQAQRDRKRDREIQEAGIYVLRFTGSEIHKNAGACVGQILNFIFARLDPEE